MLEYEQGRPADFSSRAAKEQRVYELLDSLGIEYGRVDHEHADTIEACQVIETVLGAPICKNLFLTNRQGTEFYLLLLPGDKPFKTKFFSKLIGSSRLSFAGAEDMEKYLDITPGSVSVLGLMNDREKAVHLYIDKPVVEGEYIGCHPCLNTSTLKIRTSDILQKLLPHLGVEAGIIDLPIEMEEEA